MRTYQRLRIEGGCYFFTVNLAERHGNDLLVRHIDDLRDAMRTTMCGHPFSIAAMVVLPEHLHCIWQLQPGDDDFSKRWRLIKARFSRCIDRGERRSASRVAKGERGLWQRVRRTRRASTKRKRIAPYTTALPLNTAVLSCGTVFLGYFFRNDSQSHSHVFQQRNERF